MNILDTQDSMCCFSTSFPIKSIGFLGNMNMLGKQLPLEISMDWSTKMSNESMP